MGTLARLSTVSVLILLPADLVGISIAGVRGAALASSIVYLGMAVAIRTRVKGRPTHAQHA
jgi:hypothetical protein